ncbi:MAG: hypothetical protein MI748_03405, partial [Opitutales bacterium]|nr:hypothetical protein [Opitutales bacterium]
MSSDTDGDGSSDGWEYLHGLDPLVNEDFSSLLEGYLQQPKSKLFNLGPTVFYDRNAPASFIATFDFPDGVEIGVEDLSSKWSVVRSPDGANVEFSDDSATAVDVTFSQVGVYKLKFELLTGEAYAPYDELTVFVSDTPAANYDYLIGHWDFDNLSGGVATDRSLWQSEGTVTNAISSENSWDGDSLQYNGNDSVVEIQGGADLLNGLEEVTLSAWIYSNQDSTDRTIFGGHPAISGDTRLSIRYDAVGVLEGAEKVIKATINSSPYHEPNKSDKGWNISQSSAGSSIKDVWRHLVIVWRSGDMVEIYLDGVLDSQVFMQAQEQEYLSHLTHLFIGRGQQNHESWDGFIDEVKLFGRAMEADEIYQRYIDGDSDGMTDVYERLIIDADPNDSLYGYSDVSPEGDFDNDGFSNLEEFEMESSPTIFDVKMVSGVISEVGNTWKTVPFPLSFENPVVLTTPQYSNTNQPRIVRLKDVSENGFDVKVDYPGVSFNAPFDNGANWYRFENSTASEISDLPSLQLNGAQFDNTDSLEGAYSLRLDSSNSESATVADHDSLNIGVGDFAITGWIKSDSDGAIFDKGGFSSILQVQQLTLDMWGSDADEIHMTADPDWYAPHDVLPGSWVKFGIDADLLGGVDSVEIHYQTTPYPGGTIRVRLGSPSGTIIGQGNPGHPGDWVSTSVRISTSLITGIQDIYICYEGSSGCIRWS